MLEAMLPTLINNVARIRECVGFAHPGFTSGLARIVVVICVFDTGRGAMRLNLPILLHTGSTTIQRRHPQLSRAMVKW